MSNTDEDPKVEYLQIRWTQTLGSFVGQDRTLQVEHNSDELQVDGGILESRKTK